MKKILNSIVFLLLQIFAYNQVFAQEWVTWAQEKYLTGYFISDKFNNKTLESSTAPREFVRKNLSVRENEKIK